MVLKDNLWLNRYEWASEKVKAIADQNPDINITLFDVGSRDNILKDHLLTAPILYKGFDLEPMEPATEKWNIEHPFPYSYPSPKVIALLEVIEHLSNPDLSLKNIGNLLKPGGYLILTTPNPQWSTSRLSLFSTGSLTCFTQADLDLNHHVFTPWLHVVEKLLTDAGFVIDEYVTLDGKTKVFDKTLRGGNILKKLFARMVKKIIESRDPSSCGMSYGIVAKKVA
jgi:SAM-dependent methyltransferase